MVGVLVVKRSNVGVSVCKCCRAGSNVAAIRIFKNFSSSSWSSSCLTKENVKELSNKVKWFRCFQTLKDVSIVPQEVNGSRQEKLERYTNFSLEHVWESHRFLQTHLLLREAVIPTLAENPDMIIQEVILPPTTSRCSFFHPIGQLQKGGFVNTKTTRPRMSLLMGTQE